MIGEEALEATADDPADCQSEIWIDMKVLTGIRPLAKVTYRLINKALQTVGLRLVRWRNAREFPQVIELLKAKDFIRVRFLTSVSPIG